MVVEMVVMVVVVVVVVVMVVMVVVGGRGCPLSYITWVPASQSY